MGLTNTLVNAAIKGALKMIGQKAAIVVEGDEDNPITVQFNPSEYRIIESSSYSQRSRQKKDEPVVNYNGNMLSTLNVRLYFNGDEFMSPSEAMKTVTSLLSDVDDGDITRTINRITDLTKIDGEEHKPPGCVFAWGSLIFAGVVENVGVTYTMFDKSGRPLRAVVDLTMKGFNGIVGERLSPQSSPDRTKARIMTEDNNIWNIAEKEYGDANEWRRIADANDIMNPLDIPVGTVLRVPSINDTE